MICRIWPQNDGVIPVPGDIGKRDIIRKVEQIMRDDAFTDLARPECG